MVVDILASGCLTLPLYFTNAIQPAFEDLFHEVSKNNLFISGIGSAIVGVLIFVSQVASRLYLSYISRNTPDAEQQSKELLSNTNIAMIVIVRGITIVFGKLMGMPEYFYKYVFLAGLEDKHAICLEKNWIN